MTHSEDGFSLVEVLVAFAIMAGAIIMAFSVFSDGLRGLKLAQYRNHQIQVAQHQIDLASLAANISVGTTLVIDENVKLRVVVHELSDVVERQMFIQKPLKISVFSDDAKSSDVPILETIIITKPIQP